MDAESEPRNDTLPCFPRTGQVHAYFVLAKNFSRPLWHLTCRILGEGAGERLIKHFLPKGKNNRKKNSAGIPADCASQKLFATLVASDLQDPGRGCGGEINKTFPSQGKE